MAELWEALKKEGLSLAKVRGFPRVKFRMDSEAAMDCLNGTGVEVGGIHGFRQLVNPI